MLRQHSLISHHRGGHLGGLGRLTLLRWAGACLSCGKQKAVDMAVRWQPPETDNLSFKMPSKWDMPLVMAECPDCQAINQVTITHNDRRQ